MAIEFQIFSSLTSSVSLIDNLTFKCMDSNREDVSFTLNQVTYFHIDYSLPATDFHLLMTVQIVH